MKTLKERLIAIIEESGLNRSAFAREIGIKPSSLGSYIQEKSSMPSSEVIATIALKFPQFNITWLLTGNGEMYNSGFAPPKKSEGSSELLETIEELKALVAGFNKRIEMLESYVFRKTDQLMPTGKSKTKQEGHRAMPQTTASFLG